MKKMTRFSEVIKKLGNKTLNDTLKNINSFILNESN